MPVAAIMEYLTPALPALFSAGKGVADGALKEIGKNIPARLFAVLRPEIENTRSMALLAENPSSDTGLKALAAEIECVLEQHPQIKAALADILKDAPHHTMITQHGAGAMAAGTVHGGINVHNYADEKKKS